MKSIILAGFILILLGSILIIGGCSSNQPQINADEQTQQEGSEIDQLFGVSEQEAQKQSPDEDEVLQLLGITREKPEDTTIKEASKDEDQLRKELTELEKRLADRNSEISQLKTDIAKKDERINQLESDYPKQPRISTGDYTATGNFREDYQNALSEYYNRNYKLAIQLFEELLARNATSSLSDNCRYWVGECYYGLGNFNQAIIEFTKVFSFNRSNKIDDAQLKLGLCYWMLGDRERAKQEFERLLSDYPNSEYVEKAQQFLSRL
jgi:tol-pal system protein YbgF